MIVRRVYRALQTRPLKRRLRLLAEWGRGFEDWFVWETFFSLEWPLRRMQGSPWRFDKCDLKCEYESGQADMILRGDYPGDTLVLEFKHFVPWSFQQKVLRTQLPQDFERIRGSGARAAVFLFAIEQLDSPLAFRKFGVAPPDNVKTQGIKLGKVWLTVNGTESQHSLCARLYYWTR